MTRVIGKVVGRELSGLMMMNTGEETVAFQGSRVSTIETDDGFPVVDDLSDSGLAQYRLRNVIGRGSMGRVYEAEHLTLARPCAIKVLNPGLLIRQPKMREQFWAEARVVANLVHPHIVTVHNLGSDRGYHFIEMEYVAGGITLKDKLVREGAFDPMRASSVVHQVVSALGAAHRAGLVHRDIKPTNVLLTAAGQAKLADFGLVRRLSELEMVGGSVGGTPTYMAPELFGGAPASPRSDLYAVGVMLYYLLSTRLPFAADHVSHLIQLHRKEPVPDVRLVAPDVSDDLMAIINRCLEKEPHHRYESAEHLEEELDAVIGQMLDTESLVRDSVEGLDCFIQGARDHYRIIFKLPHDRLQEVYLEVGHGRHNERLLSVFSVCCPAEPKHYEFALKLNAELTYGGLSVRTVNGVPMFVMSRTYSLAHVDPIEIRATLREIARRSDWVEQQLTHADLY
jgi:serine/threonine protein kinase